MSDRILLARFEAPIGHLVVMQVYAPTSEAAQQDVDSFYNLLQAAVNEQKSSDFTVLMGDFNAKVGADWASAGGAFGKFGIGNVNEAGERLIQFVNANNLMITNTCYQQGKANRQWMWELPDGHTQNMIDYILVPGRWRSSVINSRAYPSADIGSDHQLLIANIRLKLKAMKRVAKVP